VTSVTSHEISPLRYPGGKGGLAPFLGHLLETQDWRCKVYVEPFAGGAGAALRLLLDEFVEEIVLNDVDAGVAAFWRAVFHHTEDLARLVESADVTIDAWHAHRELYESRVATRDDLSLGFSTFFLNRTNRSGILNARPIGGLGQTGRWGMDARFNRSTLATRIRTLGHYRNRVTVLEEDGVDVARRMLGRDRFVYADPPYLVRGSDLYLDTLTWGDHERLAGILSNSDGRWMVTYDTDPRVHTLYAAQRRASFAIAHTAATPHVGREIAVFGEAIRIEHLERLGHHAEFVVASSQE
jgi:DNA adenine methylase